MLAMFHKKFVFSGNGSGRVPAVTASSLFAGIMEKAISSAKSMEERSILRRQGYGGQEQASKQASKQASLYY